MLTDKIDFHDVFWQGRVKFFCNVKNEISVRRCSEVGAISTNLFSERTSLFV